MGLVPNFRPSVVAEALDLLLHMVRLLADGDLKPSTEDMADLQELIEEIKNSR